MGDDRIKARLSVVQPFFDVLLAGDGSAWQERMDAEVREALSTEVPPPAVPASNPAVRRQVRELERKAWEAQREAEIVETNVYHKLLEFELTAALAFALKAAQRDGIGWPAVDTRAVRILATLRILARAAADAGDEEFQRMPERWRMQETKAFT